MTEFDPTDKQDNGAANNKVPDFFDELISTCARVLVWV